MIGRRLGRTVAMLAVAALAAALSTGTAGAVSSNTLYYGGDSTAVVTSKARVYLVFWGSQWGTSSVDGNGNLRFSNDAVGASGVVQQLLKSVGGSSDSWSGALTEYCSGVARGAASCPASGVPHIPAPSGGGALAGVWYDNAAPSPSAATEPQIGQEAVKAAAHFGNTTATANQAAQYVIFSPKGTNPDLYQSGGFCSWHDVNGDLGVSSFYGSIALTNLPYVADTSSCTSGFSSVLDAFTMIVGHEYAEVLTDRNPGGGWTATSGAEVADECAWNQPASKITMGTGSYELPNLWSNAANSCVP